MNNFLLSIGFLLVFALSVLFAGPHFIDWNQYRHTFEVQATKLVGREVRVGGEVSLQLLPVPFVSFEKVRIADQNGRFADPFLTMSSFTMLLSVPPLLRGDLEASGIEFQEPNFHLVIDDEKGPNWKGLGGGSIDLPIMPKNVAFKSVKFIDGRVVLKVSNDKKLLELEKVNLDFSAGALSGPYKFSGTYVHRGEVREIALVTGERQDDSLQIQTKIINPENRATYEFDGLLREGTTNPRIDGSMHAILPITGSGFALPVESRMKRAVGAAAELTAKVKGDVGAFELDELAISFESEGRPQSLKGRAQLDWKDGFAVNSELRAIWLDLDRISGHSIEKTYPWIVLRALLRGFEGNWPEADKVDITVGMDQATFGGEAINDINVQLFKAGRDLRLKRFNAQLPGSSSIRMSGQIAEGDDPAFIGDIVLRGRSFKRFRRWAFHDLLETSEEDDGYFALKGRLDASRSHLKFSRFKGEYDETSFTGNVFYPFAADQPFDIAIDSETVDLRKSVDENLTVSSLGRLWLQYFSSRSAGKETGDASDAATWAQHFSNGRLALKIGQLLLPDELFQDVDVDLNLEPGKISISQGRFGTHSGAELGLDGVVKLQGDAPRGNLNVVLDAGDLNSVRSVARVLDLPEGLVNINELSPELAPFRMAGIIKLGTREGSTTEASFDGSMGSTRATIIAHILGAPAKWKTSQVDLVGFLKSSEGSKLLAQIFSSSSDQFATGDLEGDQAPGRLALRVSGVPEKGLATVVDLEAPGVKADYRGNLAVAEAIQFEGEFSFEAQSARNVMKLVRLGKLLPSNTDRSLRGKALVLGEGGSVQVSDGRLSFGRDEILASGAVEFGENGTAVEIAARTATASLPGLLGTIISNQQAAADAAPTRRIRGRTARTSEPEFIWTDQPFDFTSFARVSGTLALGTSRLDLGQGYVARNAQLNLDFGKDGLKVEKVSGDFGGGKFEGSLDLKSAAAGVSVTGDASLTGADLRQFKRFAVKNQVQVRRSVAQGELDFDVKFEGRGLSPRGVLAILNGEGEARINKLALMHFSPEAVEVASNALLTSKKRPRKEDLEQRITDNLVKGVTRVGKRSLKFKIADGTVALDKQVLKKEGAEVTVSSYVDLNRLFLDSEWIIRPSVKLEAALPPVSIVYGGALKELSAIAPKIDAEQLSRELVVRKLELDVAALEALRKRDEELARDAEKARAEQSADWGVTETIVEGRNGRSDTTEGVRSEGAQSSASRTSSVWESSVAPVGPYGSAYDPMQQAAPPPPPKPKRRVYRKKVKKKTFNPFFQF